MPKLREAGQQCPDDAWTSHVSKVLCHWESKLTQLETIIVKGQKTNQDLQELRTLGLPSWEEALALHEQIKNFEPFSFSQNAICNASFIFDATHFSPPSVLMVSRSGFSQVEHGVV